jgi:hypothetical protein
MRAPRARHACIAGETHHHRCTRVPAGLGASRGERWRRIWNECARATAIPGGEMAAASIAMRGTTLRVACTCIHEGGAAQGASGDNQLEGASAAAPADRHSPSCSPSAARRRRRPHALARSGSGARSGAGPLYRSSSAVASGAARAAHSHARSRARQQAFLHQVARQQTSCRHAHCVASNVSGAQLVMMHRQYTGTRRRSRRPCSNSALKWPCLAKQLLAPCRRCLLVRAKRLN